MADPQVIVLTDQQAQKQLAEEIKELRKNPPDRSVPGGVFMNANGKGYHNAFGHAVTKDGKPAKPGAEPEDTDADLESMSVEELTAKADAGGVEVKGTGAGGRVLKADLVKALQTQ